MKWIGWLDEAADFLFHRVPEPGITFPMLPMSPAAEKAIKDALAGLKMDEWIDGMLKTVDIAPQQPWATANAEQIMEDIRKYQRLFAYETPRIFGLEAHARVSPLREAYAESLLRDTLNSTPWKFPRITDV